MERRVKYIDYVAGLMILTMVIEHLTVFCRIYDSVGYYIIHLTSFFMNWFFFKSGMFLKKDSSIWDCIIKGFKKLLIPFFIFTIIGVVVNFSQGIPKGITPYITLGYLNHHESLWGGVYLWFLPSLYVCKCIMTIIINHLSKRAMSATLLLSIAIYHYAMSFDELAIWMYNIPLGLIFMHLGYMLKDIQFNKNINIVASFLFILLILWPTIIDFIKGTMTPIIPAFLYSITGCIVWHNVFVRFYAKCPAFIRWMGQNAMAVYLLHWPVLSLLTQNIGTGSLGKTMIIIVLFTVLSTILIPLCVKVMKKYSVLWIIGQNN